MQKPDRGISKNRLPESYMDTQNYACIEESHQFSTLSVLRLKDGTWHIEKRNRAAKEASEKACVIIYDVFTGADLRQIGPLLNKTLKGDPSIIMLLPHAKASTKLATQKKIKDFATLLPGGPLMWAVDKTKNCHRIRLQYYITSSLTLRFADESSATHAQRYSLCRSLLLLFARGESLHFFEDPVAPDHTLPLTEKVKENVYSTEVMNAWGICRLWNGSERWDLMYVVGSSPPAFYVCLGNTAATQVGRHVTKTPKQDTARLCYRPTDNDPSRVPEIYRMHVPSDVSPVVQVIRLLQLGLPSVFAAPTPSADRRFANMICAPSQISERDPCLRGAETLRALCVQTHILSRNVSGSEAAVVTEAKLLPKRHMGGATSVHIGTLEGMNLLAAAACASSKSPQANTMLIVKWQSPACHSLWMQSTLLFDLQHIQLREQEVPLLVRNVAVFRQAYLSNTPGNLEDTWLKIAGARHNASEGELPNPWYPGAPLNSPFEVDVVLVFDSTANHERHIATNGYTTTLLDESVPTSLHPTFVDESDRSYRQKSNIFVVKAKPDEARPVSSTNVVQFTFACMPDANYEARVAPGRTFAQACSSALSRRGDTELFVPFETVVDQFQFQGEWFSTPRQRFVSIILKQRAPVPQSLHASAGKRSIPSSVQLVHGGSNPTVEMRLCRELNGRITANARSEGIGFVLDPLVWWSLAKIHYDSHSKDARDVTEHFFPIADKAWMLETDFSTEGNRALDPIYCSVHKTSLIRGNWNEYLEAADGELQSPEGRHRIIRVWSSLLDTALGRTFIRVLDESVAAFVRQCASKGESSLQRIGDLQRILFTFEGFVPLLFATAEPAQKHRQRIGVVPHSNGRLLVPPDITSDSDAIKTDLSLIAVLSACANAEDAARGVALSLLCKALMRIIFPPGARTDRNPALYPAAIFLSAHEPPR